MRGQLNCGHSVLQPPGCLGHLPSATQLPPSCRPQGWLGGHTPVVFHGAMTLSPGSLEGWGVARLPSARGADGAPSYSYPAAVSTELWSG